jgi:hypothetical protein
VAFFLLHTSPSLPTITHHLVPSLTPFFLFSVLGIKYQHFDILQIPHMDQLVRTIALTSLLAFSIFASVEARIPGVYTGGPWQNAHATFYGGSDASGTMGVSLSLEFQFLK